jgi:hypothetical protein
VLALFDSDATSYEPAFVIADHVPFMLSMAAVRPTAPPAAGVGVLTDADDTSELCPKISKATART